MDYLSFELSFQIRIVIEHMRTTVSSDHTEIGQEHRDAAGFHGHPPVRVNRKLSGLHALPPYCLSYRIARQIGALRIGDHPANNVTTENVQDHMKIGAGPLVSTSPGVGRSEFCVQSNGSASLRFANLPSAKLILL